MSTICSKHDEAIDILYSMNQMCNGDDRKFLDDIFVLIDLIKQAKKDGQKMENGLDKKRCRIKELEKEVEFYLEKIEGLELDIKYMVDKREGVL